MKFVVNRDSFTRALGRVQGVLNRKANMPALSNVLIEARSDGLLRVAGTDLDVTFDGLVEAQVATAGRTTVDGKRLFEVVRSLPGDEVDVVVLEDDRMTIRCRATEFVLHGAAPDAYPNLPSAPEGTCHPVDGNALRVLIERTAFSVSIDESRPNLNGVYFQCLAGSRLRMVSTDGHRLSQGEADGERGAEIPERDGVIIPRKGVAELKRLLDEVGREVSFGFLDNNLVVTAPGLSLFVRLIDANFPDYRQVVPRSSGRRAIMDRQALLSSLKRISILASERTHGVRIEVSPGKLVLSSDNPDLGKAREELAVEAYEGDPMVIAFNARYVREILQILDAEQVELALNEALSPGLFREHGNPDFLFVVMPMRI